MLITLCCHGLCHRDPFFNPVHYSFVKCNGKIEKVFYDEVIYIKAMLNYLVLYTEDKKLIARDAERRCRAITARDFFESS